MQLIISGGVRTGADVAKALAMGADAVAIGQGVLMALGCNSESYVTADGKHVSAVDDYAKLGTAPGYCHHCHTGRCPVGVTTQDAYDTGDVRFGLEGEHWSGSIFVRNIWDERAVTFRSNRWAEPRLSILQPRTYGLQFRYDF